jgi:hypothetical protein
MVFESAWYHDSPPGWVIVGNKIECSVPDKLPIFLPKQSGTQSTFHEPWNFMREQSRQRMNSI